MSPSYLKVLVLLFPDAAVVVVATANLNRGGWAAGGMRNHLWHHSFPVRTQRLGEDVADWSALLPDGSFGSPP